MLMIGRQFRIGDQIVVNQYEGTVERIELRAMHLRTYDNRLVIIPNGDVFTSAVTSNTQSPHRRRDFIVGVSYDGDTEKAQALALETMLGTPGVLQEPAPDVLVDELASSSINLRLRFHMSSARADFLKVGSDVMLRVKQAFDREGIIMPYETRTITVNGLADAVEQMQQTVLGMIANEHTRGATRGQNSED
jgi:small-conductance mechanosensitive channel